MTSNNESIGDQMPTNSNVKTGLLAKIRSIKSLLVSLSIVGLLATNIASLVSSSAHDLFHSMIWRMLAIGGAAFADNAMSKSPQKIVDQKVKAQTTDLDSKNKQLLADNSAKSKQLEDFKTQTADLDSKNKQLFAENSRQSSQIAKFQVEKNELNETINKGGKVAKETAETVNKRLAKGVARNVAAIPSQSVPYFGIGIIIASTSLDIYDACQTMKDINSLLVLLGQGEEKPEFCGQKVPTVDEVIANAKSDWKKSAKAVNDEAQKLQIKVSEIKPPTQKEVAMASCPIVKLPYLCNN